MRAPKGFGKRYFTLAAILAHAVVPRLHAQQSRFRCSHTRFFGSDEEENEDPPPLEEALFAPLCEPSPSPSRPCHCNRYFCKRTLLLLKLVKLIPRCTCNCRFFSFRRTGTHPPRLSFYPTR
ncbi:MAG TPA: hypothetical protein ENK93_04180 [Campylobacteraceae bacterium]|nr:hypothetical protein [Campylobacteraceae bacterium]